MTYEEILEEIEKVKKTNKLSISDATITEDIWDKICELSDLKSLFFSNSKIDIVPIKICNLVNLEELTYWCCGLQKFFTEILSLKNLKILNLYGNQLTTIPSDIFKLIKLNQLILEKNPLNALKFTYSISTKDEDFFQIFRSLKSRDILDKSMDVILDNENFIFFKSTENYAFIESFPKVMPFSKEVKYVINLQIFGDKEKRKNILFSVKQSIENWLSLYEKLPYERFFLYPQMQIWKKTAEINYEKLLSLKESDINEYFDERQGVGIPINDLIKYIGEENVVIKKEWKGTNHITNIEIQNFKIFSDFNIIFSEGINIILGNNGLGKSSILQAITFGLLPIENEDYPNHFTDYIHFNAERAEIKINWGENESRKIRIYPKGKPSQEKTIYLPIQLLLSYGVNLNTNIDQTHIEIIKELIAGESKLHFTKSIFEDNYNKLFDPIIILQDLTREYDFQKNEEIKDIISLYINTLNDFLSLIEGDEKITIQRGTIDYFYTDINNNKLKTKHLSEGYRDHILLISDILLRILAARKLIFSPEIEVTSTLFAQAKAVIIIDEFDRHLHPIWQQKLLSKFKEVLANVQFILTTHNPFSVQAAVGANVIQLVSENGKVVAKNSTVQSKNILGIIRDYFTKEFFDFESQKLLKEFSTYMDKIDEGEVELVYSQDFKDLVRKIYDKGNELQSLIASQLLQLNSTLRKLNYKEFEL